jgi:glyoxylase I family protein
MTVIPAVHHVALTVTTLDASRSWYRRLLDPDPLIDEDVPALLGHHKGFHHTLFMLPGGLILALHAHHDTDPAHRFDELRPGLDHISFGCADRGELEQPMTRLDELGIQHGRHRRGSARPRPFLSRPR